MKLEATHWWPTTAPNAPASNIPSTEIFRVPARSATHSPLAAKTNNTDSWKALVYKDSELSSVPIASNISAHLYSDRRRRNGEVGRSERPTAIANEQQGRWEQEGQNEQRLDHIGHLAIDAGGCEEA